MVDRASPNPSTGLLIISQNVFIIHPVTFSILMLVLLLRFRSYSSYDKQKDCRLDEAP